MIWIALISAYFWHWPMLADIAPAVPVAGDGVSGNVVIGIIGAIFIGLTGLFARRRGFSEGQKVSMDQPFRVQMEEQFVTRREFEGWKAEIRNDVTEMKGLFRETMKEVKQHSNQLTEQLATIAREDRNGRVALWNKVNSDSDRITSVAATSDVAGQLGKLADALTKAAKNG